MWYPYIKRNKFHATVIENFGKHNYDINLWTLAYSSHVCWSFYFEKIEITRGIFCKDLDWYLLTYFLVTSWIDKQAPAGDAFFPTQDKCYTNNSNT